MNNRALFLKGLIIGPLTALFLISGMSSVRAAEISQVPLFISLESVNPNIMFLLDDSGSMQFEGPEEFMGSDMAYVFPLANSNVYGNGGYTNRVPTVDNDKPFNAMMRSSAFNPFYYNPAITYTPWVRADGTLYPNAVIDCAYHNPENTSAGCRNLITTNTHNISWRNCTSASNCTSPAATSKAFWPATYFTYNGGGQWTWANYTKTEIKSTTSTYSGDGRTSRTDCSGGTCMYEQEIQNFANWYTYYRSRILSARAGIGRAFINQSENLRVGFGTINTAKKTIDGTESTGAILQGVRSFNTTNREAFLKLLYDCDIPAQGTPLRPALDYAGKYFSRKDNKGPWADVPGSTSGSSYSCRRSYTILMTDGYWNGSEATSPANKNNDGTDDPTITGPGSQSFTYKAVSPFTDGYSSTLADVAMYYWKNDLNTDLDNRVPPSAVNPAFWQHMVTFGVGFGVQGTATFTPAEAFAAINSSATTITWPKPGADKLENVDDLLHAAVNSRGGYFSAKDPDSFAAQLAGMLEEIVSREESSAAALATNSTKLDTGTATYQAKFNSDGWTGQLISHLLNSDGTLGAQQWNTDAAGKIPAQGSRKIYTIVDGAGREFLWANLNASQKTDLKTLNTVVGSDTLAQQRLNWIRGDRSNEKPSGALRQRTKLLGDIVNSDPFFFSGATAGTGTLYIGANDGMLHAFDAQNGVERFAYIPKAVFSNLSSLPDPAYNHKYFVDGSPIVQKLDDNRLILLGTTGAGGRSVFALNVTDPNNFSASNVLWEFTNETSSDLGYTIGQPSIGRLKDGTWVAVFGNGYKSDSGKAFLFVVNLTSGALIARIPTNNDSDNGLAKPALLPDSDGRMVAAYAGDLKGNLWKFDLTSNAVAFSSAPLFSAKNASGIAQPITSAPKIGRHPQGGYLIYFGTGKYFEVGDHTAIGVPVQSLYGVWDTASLNNGVWVGGTAIANRSIFQQQQITGESTVAGNKWRILSKNPMTWGTLASPSKRGWYVDLVVNNNPVGERITDTPILNQGRVIFTTRIPFNAADPCIPSVGTTWFMAVDMLTGGRTEAPVFDVNRDSQFNQFDTILVNGERVAVSGFEAIAAGMSRATLLQFARGSIDVLLSGTTDLTTTASATQASGSAAVQAASAATQAAQAAIGAAAQAAAQAAAAALAAQQAQAAAAAAPGDTEAAQAAEAAAAAAAAAENAVREANRALAQAIVDAAQAIIAAAQAIIDAGTGVITVARASAIKTEAQAIKSAAQAYATSGNALPGDLPGRIFPLAAELQGRPDVGVRIAGVIGSLPSKTWRQLR